MTEREVSSERVSEDFVEQVAKEIAKHTYARCLPQMSDCEDWDAMEEADRKIYRSAAEAALSLRSSVKTVGEFTLDEEELDTILAVGRNEQSGRITNYELKELVRVYRAALGAPADEGGERELTAVEKLAVSMTDEKIANALYEECETILQLLIYSREGEVASHVGAIKSWTGVLRGRAERMPKVHPSPAAASEVTEERLPTRNDAARAAEVLLRCNGHDLDVWGASDLMDDAPMDALKALTSALKGDRS